MQVNLLFMNEFKDCRTSFSVKIGDETYEFSANVEVQNVFEKRLHIFNLSEEFYKAVKHNAVISKKINQALIDKFFGKALSIPLNLGDTEDVV